MLFARFISFPHSAPEHGSRRSAPVSTSTKARRAGQTRDVRAKHRDICSAFSFARCYRDAE